IQTLMLREFYSDQDYAQFASAILYTTPFDDALAERVAELPGVAAAEGRYAINTRIISGPETWQNMNIISVSDFDTMQVDKFLYVAGAWPTAKDEIMLEWMGLDYIGADIGDTILIELGDGTQKELTITGTAHYPQRPSPEIMGNTYGFVSPETMAYLGELPQFTEMHIIAAGDDPDEVAVRRVVERVTKQIEDSGRTVLNTTIIGEFIIESIINTTALILSTFGWMILFLSGFLVVNTISALIAQQVNQIGIMKLVGAGRWQMIAMYITMVLVYGVIAFSVGIPLAVATARYLMVNLIEVTVNLRPNSYAIPLWVYGVMVGVGVLIPVFSGLLPVLQGTRITTQKALNDVGMAAGSAGDGLMEKMLAFAPRKWMQRPLLLAVRNTLRHKGRLLRTLLVLILGTALFIAVISVRLSVHSTQADFLSYHQYDVQLRMERPYRIAQLENTALALPEVVAVESWGINNAARIRPDGTESNSYIVYGLPEETKLVQPVVQAGRWLRPDDTSAVVLNATLLNDEKDIRVGDEIVLDFAGREQLWQVVGFVGTDAQGSNIYMNYSTFAYELRTPGQANSLQVIANQHDVQSQANLEAKLFHYFESHDFEVSGSHTTQTLNSRNELMFDVIIAFLILMAVLLAAVGSLGLSTTMGINMLERIREIGVLRAIG
ncbi:MAG: ABC transporter permease, partial [Anaerolineales bacterium]|nr:ABC transporter permease [Anaerolineales bacterium]